MKLFIVESPTKANTINKYLGDGWKVLATKGHIKDLPAKELAVDLNTLQAKYVYVPGKRKTLDQIKKLAKSAQEVYIATDPDREGEAIAYFVKEELQRAGVGNIYRARFYEVTKEAIHKAVRERTDIDMNLVKAQFARRIVDRLIGYILSPKASESLKKFVTVGRVQSPALALVVEQEEKIRNFKKKTFYKVVAVFNDFTLESVQTFESLEEAQKVVEKVQKGLFEIVFVRRYKKQIPAPKPFNTSSLQTEVSKALKISVDQVQRIAQELYEQGYITYPRTDTYRMNEEKAKEFMAYIERKWGKNYVGELRKFKEKETAQGAHECIRPTELRENTGLKGLHQKVYDLIVRKTLASLASPLVLDVLEIKAKNSGVDFAGKLSKVLFEGWRAIYKEIDEEEKEEDLKAETKKLPNVQKGQKLKANKVFAEKRQTQPPPRYSEGSLVKKLEALGIGRPSTYATIIKTLKARRYVFSKKELRPTQLGEELVNFLRKSYPNLIDKSLTKQMEEILDKVEEGKQDYKQAIREIVKLAGVELKAFHPPKKM